MPSASDEEDGFPVFVQQHWRSLNRTAFLLTGDRGQAEDLVQSALEKVHRHWPKVSRMDAPSDYVRRAMVTTAISWRRRRSYGEIPSLSIDPGTQDPYEQIDQRAQLIAALRRLPVRMRAAWCCAISRTCPKPRLPPPWGARSERSRARSPAVFNACASPWRAAHSPVKLRP